MRKGRFSEKFEPVGAFFGALALCALAGGCGIQLRGLSKSSRSSAAILNLSPTSVPFNLRYGLDLEVTDYVDFCILKNNTRVDDCVWFSGQLPTAFDPGPEGTYVLSVWVRDADGVVSARMDTNPVTYVEPVRNESKNVYGVPNGSFSIGYANGNAADLRMHFRDVHTQKIVHTSTVSGGGGVTLPSRAGMYQTELVDLARGGVSYGSATITDAVTGWTPHQAFTPAAFGSVRAWPDYSRTIGDYDGDGDLDFAYAEGTNGAGNPVAPGIYLYKYDSGTGQFAFDARLVSTANYIYGVKFADLDGDGDLDLVYARTDMAIYAGSLCTMLNSGSGSFGGPTCITDTGTSATNRFYAHNLAVADLNRDGKLDVVVAGGRYNGAAWTNGKTWIYLNSATGLSLTQTLDENVGMTFSDLKIADMDDDGRLDIVGLNGHNQFIAQVVVYPQAWDGTFSAATARRKSTPYSGMFALGYVNADLKPDVLVSSQGDSGGGYFLQSNANDHTYASSTVTSPTEQFCAQNAFADLDIDGTLEAYMSPKNRLLYTNKTGIYYRDPSSFSAGIGVSAANAIPGQTAVGGWNEANFDFADLNGDGNMDMLYFSGALRVFEIIRGQ